MIGKITGQDFMTRKSGDFIQLIHSLKNLYIKALMFMLQIIRLSL